MVLRDTKFDGKLYIGIISTGIVFFPSCRSRLQKRENVKVFATLEEALKAWFRPCNWRSLPDEWLVWRPDAKTFSFGEMIRHVWEGSYNLRMVMMYDGDVSIIHAHGLA